MRKWLILLSALSVTGASGAPAWTWVDSAGTVHYSDTPVPGAKQIELAGAQTFQAPARPATQSSAAPTPQSPGTQPSSSPAIPYRTFNIVSPGQQETLWNIGGTLNVQVALEPGLRPGHRLDVYLDGQLRNVDTTSTQLSLTDVPRGVHSLQAVIFDATGREVLRSLETTFIVQQTSILNPNSLPGQRRQGGN
jgi:Domain of unknown function (DUF4124)